MLTSRKIEKQVSKKYKTQIAFCNDVGIIKQNYKSHVSKLIRDAESLKKRLNVLDIKITFETLK